MSVIFSKFRRKSRRGANAIEFALTLPAFLIITFGMMEYGWYFSRVAQVNGALAQSCREGSLVDPNQTDSLNNLVCLGGDTCITDVVDSNLADTINAASLTCTNCSSSVSGSVPNRTVTCVAEVDYQALTAYLPSNWVVPNRIFASTQVRLEWQRNVIP